MRKYLTVLLFAMAALFVTAPAYAFENLCANNPDPTARIKCWQKGPAFSGLVPAQYEARCPDKSHHCFTDVLNRWWVCLPYAQSANASFTPTRGFAARPEAEWTPTVQQIDATLTIPALGPADMKRNYPRMISAEGFGEGWFGNTPAEAQNYAMNMCLDSRLW